MHHKQTSQNNPIEASVTLFTNSVVKTKVNVAFFQELFLQMNLNVPANMASTANSHFLTIWGIPDRTGPSISGYLSFIRA